MDFERFRRAGLTRAIAVTLAAAPWVMPGDAQAQNVDLGDLGDRGFRIDGIDADDRSGFSVSGAGDVNGDGLADLIIGAYRADPGGDNEAGESYVVFGKSDNNPVDLANLGSGGFRIHGIDTEDWSGRSVSGAGDVNGDGLADLIVGAYRADPDDDSAAGESYVVFGKPDNAPVDLGNLGSGGFRIDGFRIGDSMGFSVSGAGDVNGDGLDDLIVGALRATVGGQGNAGESYLVFGKTDSAPVNFGIASAAYFEIEGVAVGDLSGASVSGAGDVNGDGLADLIIGAPGADGSVGKSYVVFGKNDSTTVQLANLGNGGFPIDGSDLADLAGTSVAGAGDVNGDGLADLIIGARGADPGGVSNAGESYVVFGKTSNTPINLGDLRTTGFRINGIDASDYAGRSVAAAGDLNGDGLADLIIGAYRADPGGNSAAGESYVVFGKPDNASVNLANLGSGGFRLDGIDADDRSGISVSGAGDVNGDGLADLIIGASGADPGGDSEAGESYIVFSTAVPPPSAIYRARSRNGDPPRTAVGISGDGSDHSSPAARLWVDFAHGVTPQAPASTETVTLTRSSGGFPGAAANVSWRLQTTRQIWAPAEVTVRYLDGELLVGNEQTLQLVYSPNGSAPFTPLASVVNPLDNTISAMISQAGFLYIGQGVPTDEIYANGFESTP